MQFGDYWVLPSTGTAMFLEIGVAFLSIIVVLQVMWNRRWHFSNGNLPPGSMGIFGFGETIYLMINPSKYYEKRQKHYGRIYKTHIFGSPTIRVSGGDNVCPIFNGEHDIVEAKSIITIRRLLGDCTISQSSGSEHKEKRRHVLSGLKKSNLQNFIPRIQRIIEEVLTSWCIEDRVLVYKRVQQMTFHAAWEVIIGLQLSKEDAKEDLELFNTFIGGFFTVPFNIPGFPFYKALKAKDNLRRRISEAVAKGESLSQSSVLGTILQHERDVGKEPDNSKIQDATTELLFAGFETLSSAATSLTMVLAKEETVRQKLLIEMAQNGLDDSSSSITFDVISQMVYLNGVIKEVLRLYPPVAGAFRTATKTFKIKDFTVPEGWTVLPNIFETHERANLDNNDQFLPERWTSEKASKASDLNYIPFGAGPRICVGREYAKLFLRVYAVCLLRMCDFKLLSDKQDFTRVPIVHPKDYLPAKFTDKDMQRESSSN